jgi:hypothetical protein
MSLREERPKLYVDAPEYLESSSETLAHFNSRIRLVRLRPEFADIYPGLDPMIWETATELAARLLVQHGLPSSPAHTLTGRILSDEHFEFQGGDARGTLGKGMRSRVSDGA